MAAWHIAIWYALGGYVNSELLKWILIGLAGVVGLFVLVVFVFILKECFCGKKVKYDLISPDEPSCEEGEIPWLLDEVEEKKDGAAPWLSDEVEETEDATAPWLSDEVEETEDATASWLSDEVEETKEDTAPWLSDEEDEMKDPIAMANWDRVVESIKEIHRNQPETESEEMVESMDGVDNEPTSPIKILISPSEEMKLMTKTNEMTAVLSVSDMELDRDEEENVVVMSSYGDLVTSGSGSTPSTGGSLVSVSSNARWLTPSTASNLNLKIHTSLFYSEEMRYIAGKIIEVDGLTFKDEHHPSRVRIHVVVLPIKAYALKTNWHQIPSNGNVKIDEYFEFIFKSPPSDYASIILRVRLYGRQMTLGRAKCMGECYITLLEIINAGHLTSWSTLSRGMPQAIYEGQF